MSITGLRGVKRGFEVSVHNRPSIILSWDEYEDFSPFTDSLCPHPCIGIRDARTCGDVLLTAAKSFLLLDVPTI